MALESKGHFQINGDKQFRAKSLKVGFESLNSEDSGRTDDGVMRLNWIFRKIRKVEIEMPPITSGDVAELLGLVQGQEYYLTYFDPLDNSEKTIFVYTSNSSADLYSGMILNGLWQGVSFNAIEVAGEG